MFRTRSRIIIDEIERHFVSTDHHALIEDGDSKMAYGLVLAATTGRDFVNGIVIGIFSLICFSPIKEFGTLPSVSGLGFLP